MQHSLMIVVHCSTVVDEEKRRKRGGEEKETLRMSEHRPLPERVKIYYISNKNNIKSVNQGALLSYH